MVLTMAIIAYGINNAYDCLWLPMVTYGINNSSNVV
jgi:hypothetical protein